MARLRGTGRVADDLYLLAHDDVTGKPFLQRLALGIGLAGGLLAELMFTGTIWIGSDRIEFTRRGQPKDELSRHVLGLLLAEPDGHPLRDWLLFLSTRSAVDVGRRLEQAGYLVAVRSRRPWRSTRLRPANSDAAFAAPFIRVRAVLDPARPATLSDVVLAGLAAACGLGPRVWPYAPAGGARKTLQAAIRDLDPGLRDLIATTQATVDSALLSHRV